MKLFALVCSLFLLSGLRVDAFELDAFLGEHTDLGEIVEPVLQRHLFNGDIALVELTEAGEYALSKINGKNVLDIEETDAKPTDVEHRDHQNHATHVRTEIVNLVRAVLVALKANKKANGRVALGMAVFIATLYKHRETFWKKEMAVFNQLHAENALKESKAIHGPAKAAIEKAERKVRKLEYTEICNLARAVLNFNAGTHIITGMENIDSIVGTDGVRKTPNGIIDQLNQYRKEIVTDLKNVLGYDNIKGHHENHADNLKKAYVVLAFWHHGVDEVKTYNAQSLLNLEEKIQAIEQSQG